jgi:hypothetical protein
MPPGRCLLFLLACSCAFLVDAKAELTRHDSRDHFQGQLPVFRSGDVVPSVGVFTLELKPSHEIGYLVGPVRARGDDGYGGAVTLAKITAGQYWIAVSRPVDLELMQNYVRLELHEREGDTPTFEVRIEAGAMLLQVRSISDAPLSVAIWPRPGT